MEAVLLIDFGSTYTKVTAVDTSKPLLLGSASAYTTVTTDVGEGLSNALAELEKQTGVLDFNKRLACSSAAGGLRMIACGLAPELTAKAASLASLGAGAKVVGLYSYELTEEDVDEIDAAAPDILLLTGGTDGGNKSCILHNAEALSKSKGGYPIVVAGNRNCGRGVLQSLSRRNVYLCENVMPVVGTLNIEPARQTIRGIFLENIIHAKGLSNVAGLQGSILMPTPAAVLEAAEFFAEGCEDTPGIGDLIVVDVGGATTDVYSICDGAPRGVNTICKGLPEPFAKRTVEGDIGMRYSAQGIVEAAGISRVAELAGVPEKAALEYVRYLAVNTDALPGSPEQKTLDFILAALAIETATQRHAGTIEEVYTAAGRAYVQTGKDLTDVSKIVMTGGALLHTDRQNELAAYALFNDRQPQSLRPKQAQLLVDKHYILAAMGLLSGYAPKAALELLKQNCM